LEEGFALHSVKAGAYRSVEFDGARPILGGIVAKVASLLVAAMRQKIQMTSVGADTAALPSNAGSRGGLSADR
jgi:hypothetical protein